MADPIANYVFLPWVSQGAAAGIRTIDNPDNIPDADPAGVVSVTVKLRVNDTPPIEQQVRLYGPGDVIGIDPQQVIRTEPRHLAQDFEPNYFPAIEFDRPDFPWLFTPAKAAADGKLRPWLCLVAVRKQEGVRLRTDRALPLPVLEIGEQARPDRELPDLSESWAWAHAQVVSSRRDAESLKSSLKNNPALTVSRLLCPRRLDPSTEYLACVVPAFELGRLAGLGLPIGSDDEKTLKPAWASGDQAPPEITLPVYYHWEFRTGIAGDFEALASLLEPRPMPEKAGKRPIDISQPGFQITPAPPGTTLEFEGALRAEETKPRAWPQETREPFQEALAKILNAPWQAMKEGLKEEESEPLLGPPIYGCWQANQHIVKVSPEPPPSPPWLHELNLDPRYRAAAALGTRVVQAQQEQLMASAWEQLGEIERINQMQRQAQLARAVNGVYYATHFAHFSEERLLNMVAPAQTRLVIETDGPNDQKARAMLSHRISQSAMPDRTISAPMRRLTNPRGAISARFRSAGTRPIAMVARLNASASLVPVQRKPAGWVTINQVSDQASDGLRQDVRFERVSSSLDSARRLGKFNVSAEGNTAALLTALTDPSVAQPAVSDSPDAAAFRQAAQAHQDYINQRVFRTIWQNYKAVFSGGNGIIYGVDHRGRLRFYRDQVQSGVDEMPISLVIGQGGWLQFQFLFSGGDGIIYAVNQNGQLLFYRDKAQDGTGDVANPSVIGQGGWLQFKSIFSGGNGIIYAVEPGGQLRFYRDEKRNGTNDIANPKIIGQSGWQNFKFVFSGGNGVIYAVDQAGRLLFFRDKTQNGTGVVAEPTVISPGGWLDFSFVFSGGNGMLYAVDQPGRLLVSRDETQDGTGAVSAPSVVSSGSNIFAALPMDLSKTRDAVLQSVDPERTIKARVQASIVLGNAVGKGRDPLEPLQDAPEFPQPMYEALRDLSQDFLFPGLEHVLPNTVTLLETNSKFVESFLVGLNAEMSHELLWRGFPTGLRGTYFRQFWDASEDDIKAINEWDAAELGENARGSDSLVLLIRGELLRRYPNSVIYAVQAAPQGEKLSDHELYPLFRGTLKPDVTFLGFDLRAKDAISDPGWFFVIQEQPTEPRFGLDEAKFDTDLPELTSWNELSWGHLAETEEELKALSYASAKTAPQSVMDAEFNKVKWGKNAAHQAVITLQRPVRIAIHASKLIPQG